MRFLTGVVVGIAIGRYVRSVAAVSLHILETTLAPSAQSLIKNAAYGMAVRLNNFAESQENNR